jgi:dUTPase
VPSTISRILGKEESWLNTSWLSWRSAEERVTMMPVATEMIRAGTCVTMPSPMVSRVKVLSAADQSMPS